MVVFPLAPPGVVYANFQPIKMPNPLANIYYFGNLSTTTTITYGQSKTRKTEYEEGIENKEDGQSTKKSRHKRSSQSRRNKQKFRGKSSLTESRGIASRKREEQKKREGQDHHDVDGSQDRETYRQTKPPSSQNSPALSSNASTRLTTGNTNSGE